MSWRIPARLSLVSLIVFSVIAGGSIASATTDTVRSEPNGDVSVTVSVGSLTDRDRDGDFNTGTKGDIASLFFSVVNQSDITQAVQIDYALDGPGSELDQSFTQEVVLEPGGVHQDREEFRVKQKTLKGGYALAVTASGTESATAIGTFTLD
jgi:hypothetical protein